MAGENPVPDTPTQRENLSIDEILVPVQEVLVPAEYIPSMIPVYQRLKAAPYKFRVVVVNVKKRTAYWVSSHYFLTDGEGLVDIDGSTTVFSGTVFVSGVPLVTGSPVMLPLASFALPES
jgi:hypothetical protein